MINALVADASAKGLFLDENQELSTNKEMVALKWFLRIGEVNTHRKPLGEKLLEVCNNKLTQDPRGGLTAICNHFGIDPKESWLEYCCEQLDSALKNQGEGVVLPPKMCEIYNTYQEQYGFEGRAVHSH